MASKLSEEISVSRIIQRYGGWKKLFISKYFLTACLLLIPTHSLWSKAGWWDTIFSIVPNLLGFTIGAFSLTIAFGDEKFKELLAKTVDDEDSSPLQEMSATFLIFIAVQTLALIAAIACKGMWETGMEFVPEKFFHLVGLAGVLIWGVSYFLFLYGILLALAAARWIHMLAVVYTAHAAGQKPPPGSKPK